MRFGRARTAEWVSKVMDYGRSDVSATPTQIGAAATLWLYSRPLAFLSILCAAQILLWTLAPTLTSDAPPLDVVENTAWGTEWIISSYKNPSLSYFLLELARLLTGAIGWPAYILSQLFICSTFVLVFLLSVQPLGTERALAGTLLLTGVYYFSWPTPEFNQDVAQMPLWAGVALALWRATETRRMGWWVALGLFAAASMYAKLSTSVLLIAAAAWILLDRQRRSAIATPGPWIGLALFAIAVSPLAVWLIKNGFPPIQYAVGRGRSHAIAGPMFVVSQVAAVLPMLGMLAVSTVLTTSQTEARVRRTQSELEKRFVRYLVFLTAAPILITVGMTAMARTGAKPMWGVPMLNLVGLLAVSLTWYRFDTKALRRLAYCAMTVLIAVPTGYAAAVLYSPMLAGQIKRQNWPQTEIATRMGQVWTKATGRPLRIVAGNNWLAGLVALSCCEKPASLFTYADFALSPWITEERIAREGVLIVWRDGDLDLEKSAKLVRLIGSHDRGAERFTVPRFPGAKPIDIRYAILPPRA